MGSEQENHHEIMSFATTWMDLEIIIVNAVKSDREKQIKYHVYVESKKIDTSERTCKTEVDSQT